MSGEFLSPKIRDTEVDLTLNVSGGSSSVAAVVISATKGPVGEPKLITSIQSFIDTYGQPNISDQSTYAALAFLSKGSQLWVVRYTDGTAQFADDRLQPVSVRIVELSGNNSANGRLQAILTYSDTSTEYVTHHDAGAWSSSNDGIAQVDQNGGVTGVSDGVTSINFNIFGLEGNFAFTVQGAGGILP